MVAVLAGFGALAATIHSVNQQNRINDVERRLDALESVDMSSTPSAELSSICSAVI